MDIKLISKDEAKRRNYYQVTETMDLTHPTWKRFADHTIAMILAQQKQVAAVGESCLSVSIWSSGKRNEEPKPIKTHKVWGAFT